MTVIINGTTGIDKVQDGSITSADLASGAALANIGASGVTAAYLDTQSQYTGFKNRIINGAMMIDQRNAGASVTNVASAYTYALDRWSYFSTQASKFTIQQNAGSVTPPAGFSNYLGITSSSAYSIVSGDLIGLRQAIEGLNIADLGWGTAGASPVTLSFKVYSSLTGTFGGSVQNSAQSRSYPFTYTVSTANTWTTVSITIAGDTSGTWLTTNGIGISVWFNIGSGATYSGTAGTWASANYVGATGQTSIVGTNGATFYITGVQLEKGSTATSFDYRPYGTELALCQRYFQQFGGTTAYEYIGDGICTGSAGAYVGINLITTMRAAPSFSFTGVASDFTLDAGNGNIQCTTLSLNAAAVNKVRINANVTSGLTTSAYRTFLTYSGQTSKVQFSAEL